MRCLACKHDGVPTTAELCPHCKANIKWQAHYALPPGATARGGRYRVDYALEQGDFGITYRAWDMEAEQPVALREYFPRLRARREHPGGNVEHSFSGAYERQAYARAVQRFEDVGRELQRHWSTIPNAAAVTSTFRERNTAYYVMEFVSPWRSLRDEMGAAGWAGYTPERVGNIIGQLASQLAFAHRVGLYHYNVMPENVLVADEGRTFMLVNFGEENLLTTEYDLDTIVGLPSWTSYVPPEHVIGERSPAPPADLYGLGVMLYELLTGKFPPNFLSRSREGAEWEPTDLKGDWKELVASVLRVHPEERPQSVEKWWHRAAAKQKEAADVMRCLHCFRDGVPASATVCQHCGAYLPHLMRDVLLGGTTLHGGKYRVEHVLGRGGFGVLYLARHVTLEQRVAIKEFYPRDHAQREGTTGELIVPGPQRQAYRRALQRFIREGRTLALLNHPHVVRVQDLFEERGTGYLVMELVVGRTLKDELESAPGGRLPPERVEAIMEQLVGALETVHEAGVYHLDIKPDNILLRRDGRVVLVDFGASRQGIGSKSTQAFTMEYAAPEVIAGGEVGPGSDLFELGMVLHEMLTGERPAPALGRLLADTWACRAAEEPWLGLINSALRLRRDERAQSVRGWWQARPAPKPAGTTAGRGAKKAAAPPFAREREWPAADVVEVLMPQMGESIAEGTITRWLKQVGERVERDEPLFEISTDKVDAEIPSPAAGTLQEIKFKEGDTVEVNTVVAVILPARPAGRR